MKPEPWIALLPRDPRPALLACDEPAARFVARTALLGAPADDPAVMADRAAVVADPRVRALVERLPSWDTGFSFSGHNSPGFPPNLLRLLHGLGVRAGDFAQIERLLDQIPLHQAEDGRLLTPGISTGKAGDETVWTSLPCDHFALTELLLLFGRPADGPGFGRAFARMRDTLTETAQGPAWLCLPDPVAKWRGPGRKGDACLQVTVEALRCFALAPADERPPGLHDAARTLLRAWRHRATEKPYMFGHGPRFIAGKWPPTWYDASAVLEALAPYPSVWSGAAPGEDRGSCREDRDSCREDRDSCREIAAALATVFGPDGWVTPQSCYKGFEAFSFGQKKRPSPWATARLCGILRRFSPIL